MLSTDYADYTDENCELKTTGSYREGLNLLRFVLNLRIINWPSPLANPFRSEEEAAVLTEVVEHFLGNFLVVIPGAGDFQNGHVW